MSDGVSDDLRARLIGLLAHHAGGWLDNGKPDKCRCHCGHRPKLGELHAAHVADDILSSLTVTVSNDTRTAPTSYARVRTTIVSAPDRTYGVTPLRTCQRCEQVIEAGELYTRAYVRNDFTRDMTDQGERFFSIHLDCPVSAAP